MTSTPSPAPRKFAIIARDWDLARNFQDVFASIFGKAAIAHQRPYVIELKNRTVIHFFGNEERRKGERRNGWEWRTGGKHQGYVAESGDGLLHSERRNPKSNRRAAAIPEWTEVRYV